MKIPARSLILVISIFAASIWGRQALNIINASGARGFLLIGIFLALAGSSVWLLKGSAGKILVLTLIMGAALSQFMALEEVWHIIAFGILGVSLARESKSNPYFGIGIGTFVCIGDELLQWALPNRVGDPKDVIINLASFCVFYWRFVVTEQQGDPEAIGG